MAIGKGVSGGLKFLKSPKGKSFLKKLGDNSKKAERRWKSALERWKRVTDPRAKKRWARRVERYEDKYHEIRIAEDLAAKGIIGRGPVLEFRRNLLAMEWEEADAEGKKKIVAKIEKMDKRLKRLLREVKLAEQYQGVQTRPSITVKMGATSPDKAAEGLGRALKKAGVPATAITLMTAPHLSLAYEVSDVGSWRVAGKVTAAYAKSHHLAGVYIQTDAYSLFGVTADPVAVAKAVDLNYKGHVHRLNEDGGWGGPISLQLQQQGSPSIVRLRDPYVKDAVERRDISRELMNGLGGLAFNVQSPPGSGRLARLPFYPARDVNSWTGTGGIEHPGDDPVLNLIIGAAARTADAVRMFVPKIDYGIYRVLGLQTNHQESYGLRALPFPDFPAVAISISNLELYNGQQLFLQDPLEEIAADTYSILPTSTTRSPNPTFPFEAPYNYGRRRSRFFAGLRDYPVIKNNVEVFLTVRAFIKVPVPGIIPPRLEIPFTANLIVDILEDKVFGDPVNPSPVSRAGATIKLGTRELGVSWEGHQQIEVVSPHYIPRRLRLSTDGTNKG